MEEHHRKVRQGRKRESLIRIRRETGGDRDKEKTMGDAGDVMKEYQGEREEE